MAACPRFVLAAVPALAAVMLLAAAEGGARQAGDTQRLVAVVGDLHMGSGRDAAGAWPAGEDFRWADEFERFLAALDAEGGGATDLILNGDTFELAADECVRDDPGLGCTEAEALAALERVLAAHTRAIEALAAFARAGANRVVLVPGDHDAALLFPAVRARAEAALGGRPRRSGGGEARGHRPTGRCTWSTGSRSAGGRTASPTGRSRSSSAAAGGISSGRGAPAPPAHCCGSTSSAIP